MHLTGKCPCGKVTFEVNGDPVVQLYCHCRSCQTAHAAPVVAATLFRAESVTYSGDVQRVTVTEGENAPARLTCTSCGTRVIVEPKAPVRTIFPALCTSSGWFKPQMHVQWQDHTVEVQDDLPKFLDWPKEFGGTGERP